MKIGIITPEYPPYAGGGIGTSSAAFANHMAAAGHRVEVFAIFSPDIKGYNPHLDGLDESLENVNIHYLSYHLSRKDFSDDANEALQHFLGKDLGLAKSWIVAQKVSHFLTNNPLDIIFSAEYIGLPAFFLLQQKLLNFSERTPVVLTLHTGQRELNDSNYHSFRNVQSWEKSSVLLEKLSIEHATRLHCPSQFLADFVNERYYSGSLEIEVIPNFQAFSGSLATPRGPEVKLSQNVLFLGRCERRKGVREFVQAALCVLKNGHDYYFTVVGGEWFDELIEEDYGKATFRDIPGHLKDRFKFTGMMPHDELPEVIRQADVVVVPSLFENYPNTCIEAVQLGVPVLISHLGGMQEAVGVQEEMVFDPRYKEEFADKIVGFLSLGYDERAKVYSRQRDCFETKHDPGKTVRDYEQLVATTIDPVNVEGNDDGLKSSLVVGVGLLIDSSIEDAQRTLHSIASQTIPPQRILLAFQDDVISKDDLDVQGLYEGLDIVRFPDFAPGRAAGVLPQFLSAFQEMDVFTIAKSGDLLHQEFLSLAANTLMNNRDYAAVLPWSKSNNTLQLDPMIDLPDVLVGDVPSIFGVLFSCKETDNDLDLNEIYSNLSLAEWDYWLGFLSTGRRVIQLPKVLYVHRQSYSGLYNKLNHREYLHVVEEIASKYQSLYKDNMMDVLVGLHSRLYDRQKIRFWPTLFHRLPGKLSLFLRRQTFLKNLGYRLLNKG